MQLGFPDRYPSACALPFNRASLERDFQLASPDRDPGGSGVYLLLSGAQLLLPAKQKVPQLPTTLSGIEVQSEPLYLGDWQGRPCRLLTVKGWAQEEWQSHSLQSRSPQLPLAMLSLAGIGGMIRHWEASSRYCGYCGSVLERLASDWGKKCPGCGKLHYPRIHPCVIGLIVRGQELLLVRKPEWQPQRFGLVAGFVEFGESLEQAMAREALEETGIEIANLRYLGSQCWPFPSQLMHGFVCDYAAGELILQEDELAEANWYRFDQLPEIPPRRSIARYLIDRAAEFVQR